MLAIDAVSDADLLKDVFPGGVFWLNVGKMSSGSEEISSTALLEKVQNFIARMDVNRSRPPNLESATDYLQEVMMEQYPQSLLILDDVWEVETSEVFAVRCRTLVTTCNAEVASGINTPDVYPVPVMEVSRERCCVWNRIVFVCTFTTGREVFVIFLMIAMSSVIIVTYARNCAFFCPIGSTPTSLLHVKASVQMSSIFFHK